MDPFEVLIQFFILAEIIFFVSVFFNDVAVHSHLDITLGKGPVADRCLFVDGEVFRFTLNQAKLLDKLLPQLFCIAGLPYNILNSRLFAFPLVGLFAYVRGPSD